MLHDFRKDVDYYTMASLCSVRIKKEAVKLFSNHLFLYLESKYSCNPLIKDESKSRVKEKLKKLIEENPRFGFSRIDVIRYIPVSERSEVRRRERHNRKLTGSVNKENNTFMNKSQLLQQLAKY